MTTSRDDAARVSHKQIPRNDIQSTLEEVNHESVEVAIQNTNTSSMNSSSNTAMELKKLNAAQKNLAQPND